jgi:methionine sulfoxide reductase heme-binding subunit
MLRKLSPYWLWLVLAIPAFVIINDAITSTNPRIFHILVHPSGETSARLLIVTLMATLLAMLFRKWQWPRWLVRNRRYFGVAAFAYAALHTLFYILDKSSIDRMVGELERLYIWTGWLAFLIFLPLAATSFDFAVRRMGRAWKSLQRWVYAAAALTLLHWAALHGWKETIPAMIHFGPLIALTIYRVWRNLNRPVRTRGLQDTSMAD